MGIILCVVQCVGGCGWDVEGPHQNLEKRNPYAHKQKKQQQLHQQRKGMSPSSIVVGIGNKQKSEVLFNSGKTLAPLPYRLLLHKEELFRFSSVQHSHRD